jgi:hypothetical protein
MIADLKFHDLSSSVVRRSMKARTSLTITRLARVHAILNRRCRSGGMLMDSRLGFTTFVSCLCVMARATPFEGFEGLLGAVLNVFGRTSRPATPVPKLEDIARLLRCRLAYKAPSRYHCAFSDQPLGV